MSHSKKKLFKMVDKIPAFPQSTHRILQLTSDINCAPKDLVTVFDHDPVLTLQLLKLVNSPYFGLSHKISSVKQAVVFVGINTVKNLALRLAPFKALHNDAGPRKHCNQLADAQSIHATTTAVISRRLARRIGVTESEVADYFVAGLLHDFGQLVFARCQPKRFQRAINDAARKGIPLIKMEKHVFGLDHTELGAYLGEKWRLPEMFTNCMRDHHTRKVANPTLLHDCIYTANLLANALSSGYPHYPYKTVPEKKLPKAISQHFGMTLSELMHSLGDVSEEVSRTRALL